MPTSANRSYVALRKRHLRRLSEIASRERDRMFEKYPQYRRRLLCVVLAQGAAQHWVDGSTGVKDLDVWTFYAAVGGERFPWSRRVGRADFGSSDLGRPPYANSRRAWLAYSGRRVDLMARSLPVRRTADPVEAVRGWLIAGRQPSPKLLREKPMVMIDPSDLRGRVIWHGTK